MDGFDTIDGGEMLEGYTQFNRRTIPNYFAYADRFVLTDRFFTSEYGPTFPEHLYTVAAQSDGIMDNKSEITDSPGRYCDDPNGYSPAFPQDLSAGAARPDHGRAEPDRGRPSRRDERDPQPSVHDPRVPGDPDAARATVRGGRVVEVLLRPRVPDRRHHAGDQERALHP